jgi:hypothetical protein
MGIREKDKGTFKSHSLSKKAFAEIKEVKDKVNPEKIPSALSDAVVFRYFASGRLKSYDKVNETTLTKQMIILHGLYSVPKIIPTIYFYGPYPYSMRETLEESEKLKESNIRHYLKEEYADLNDIDAEERKREWKIDERNRKQLAEKYPDLSEFEPLFAILNQERLVGKSLIDLSYDIVLHRNKPAEYPRTIHINEEREPAVLYSIAIRGKKRFEYLQRSRQKIRWYEKSFPERSGSCEDIILDKRVPYTQDLKDGITNKLLILNALSLYHTIFNMKPTVEDLCHTLCSHYSKFDMETNGLKKRLNRDRGRNYDFLKKLDEGSITVEDVINSGLLSLGDYRDWGVYVDREEKPEEAIGHLREVGRVEIASDLAKLANLSPDEKKTISRIDRLMQKKKEIGNRVLICLTEMKKEKLIEKRGEVVSLKCSFVENEALKDGNVIDEECWNSYTEEIK